MAFEQKGHMFELIYMLNITFHFKSIYNYIAHIALLFTSLNHPFSQHYLVLTRHVHCLSMISSIVIMRLKIERAPKSPGSSIWKERKAFDSERSP